MEVTVDIEGGLAYNVPLKLQDTVRDLKEKVESLVDVPVYKQVFFFNGRVLQDDERGIIPNGSLVKVLVESDDQDFNYDTQDLPLLVHDEHDLKRKRQKDLPPPPQVDVAQPSASAAVEAKKRKLLSFDDLLVKFEKSFDDLPINSERLFDDLLFNSEEPLLVAFYNEKCKESVAALVEVSTLLTDKIQAVKIDTEKYPTVADKNKIGKILPVYIIFTDGKRSHCFVGATAAEELIKYVMNA